MTPSEIASASSRRDAPPPRTKPTTPELVAALRDAESVLYSGAFRTWVRSRPPEERQAIVDLRGQVTLAVNRLITALIAGQIEALKGQEQALKDAAEAVADTVDEVEDFVEAMTWARRLLDVLTRVAGAAL